MALKGMILVSHGFNEQAYIALAKLLKEKGFNLDRVSDIHGLVNSWTDNQWGLSYSVDSHISSTLGSDYDYLILPEGAKSVDRLKANPHTKRIISHFIAARKPMIAVGDASEFLKLADGFDIENYQDFICLTSFDDHFTSLNSWLSSMVSDRDASAAAA